MVSLCPILLLLLGVVTPAAQEPVLTQFRAGDGPTVEDGVYHLLDSAGSFSQSNTLAFSTGEGTVEADSGLRAKLRVLKGGDGGGFVFLNTLEYGGQGPAPFLGDWTAPNLRGSFGVGIDVHDPKNEDPFRGPGNYQGLPQREISLHWDGRELVKRVADQEFRGDWADLEISWRGVPGGSEVTVRIGVENVYESYFVAGMHAYEWRLAMGASTLLDVATEFDVKDIAMTLAEPSAAPRPPIHFPVFNHVLTNNSKTAFQIDVDLPPANWEFGRVILTLQIHDAGESWDEWDRNGTVSLWDDEGNKHTIVPFITSYRTECFWQVDVTAFRPWLAGKTKIEVAAGTTFYKNRGFMMSVDLDYYHGTPTVNGESASAFDVIPLWEGTAHYRSHENHYADFFTPVGVVLPDHFTGARVMTFTTGHSQIGEFTASDRTLYYTPSVMYDNQGNLVPTGMPILPTVFRNGLWKTDCYLNPNRPQGGTWKYSRAGWAPGDVVAPWWADLPDTVTETEMIELRYEATPYDFSDMPEADRPDAGTIGAANQVVSSYLVLYNEGAGSVPAPVLRVTGVTGGSSAAKAGILAGDYLSSYDGKLVDSVADLSAAKAAATEAGLEVAKIVVYRGAEKLELEMATGQMGVNLSGG